MPPDKPSLNSAFNCCYVLRDGATSRQIYGFFLEYQNFVYFLKSNFLPFPTYTFEQPASRSF